MAGPATVVSADLECSNGVIHVIDTVLLPPAAPAPPMPPPAPAPLSIVDTAVGNGAFTVLVEALQVAGLVDALSGPGPFTVFAPTDAAFTALLEQLGVTKEELLQRTDLATILQYHVISGKVLSSDLAATQDVTTLTGDSLTVTSDGTTVMAGPASVVIADVDCSNGVIHAIDAVLLPPAAPAPPPVPCSDGNQMCGAWAANGECEGNPGWMLENCRQSCGVCSPPAPGPCSDDNQMCGEWAANGECQSNPGYMLEHCCQSCSGPPTPAPPAPPAPPPPPPPAPPSSPSPVVGCCRFEADCGDCGEDGTGWCHQSASNC